MALTITEGVAAVAGVQTATVGATRDTIIRRALRLVGAYASGVAPRADMVNDAAETLDMMLNSWQLDGALWLREWVWVTLAADQAAYDIGPTSSDTVTYDAAGSQPYTQRPPRIHGAMRYTITTEDETPLTILSREDYLALPNKSTSGTPVYVYFDPQISDAILHIWPVPAATGDKVRLWVDRRIADVGGGDNILDVPPEWMECVVYNLAARLSPEYPPGLGAEGLQYALLLKEKMDSYQRDDSPVYFCPAR